MSIDQLPRAPNADYDGRYFRHHYYGRIGDFDSKEEFECACKLDQLAASGRIRFWVRNLVNKCGASFFLQKAGSRFYPELICASNGKCRFVMVKSRQWQQLEGALAP